MRAPRVCVCVCVCVLACAGERHEGLWERGICAPVLLACTPADPARKHGQCACYPTCIFVRWRNSPFLGPERSLEGAASYPVVRMRWVRDCKQRRYLRRCRRHMDTNPRLHTANLGQNRSRCHKDKCLRCHKFDPNPLKSAHMGWQLSSCAEARVHGC